MQFNPLIPELSVSNLARSLKFYVETLGFQIEYSREESLFAFVSLQGSQLMLEERNGHWETGSFEYPLGRGINFQILVADLNLILQSLQNAAYPLMKAPWESQYRKGNETVVQREFLVQDPDGYLLRFAQKLPAES